MNVTPTVLLPDATRLGLALGGMTALLTCAAPVLAAPVKGETTDFRSPAGVVEECIRIEALPGAHYSSHDRKQEQAHCSLDLYQLALCPKLWSTSPGTILYELENDTPAHFEQSHCASGHAAKSVAADKPAVFKMSVNARDTSATYAPSSWIYYHFSRLFQTQLHVPVAVYRSMELAEHHRRVVKPALQLTGNRHSMRMLAAGWRFLDQLESAPENDASARAVLTDGGAQVFGVLLDGKGDRYGPEINGTRESGWGSGQNFDFQQTAPFLALRNAAPVSEAIETSVAEARRNPRMAKALPADISSRQMVLWMQDILEITLLDYILGQQDRIGNIDYIWRWAWVEDGRIHMKAAHGHEVPADLKAYQPIRIRQSAINDNDAGVRGGYADFAEKTHMLEGLRHYSPRLYQQLGVLHQGLQPGGEIGAWLTESAGLSQREAERIANRTHKAWELLQADCRSGELSLDLDPALFLQTGESPAPAPCD